MMIYAGIGSRRTPPNIVLFMKHLGRLFAGHGWTLRSGGAEGADSAFEHGCRTTAEPGILERFIPWPGYNSHNWTTLESADARRAEHAASQVHPAWDRCSTAVRKLHGRNAAIILGEQLDTPVDLVICYTADGTASGGTGTGIRLAEQHRIAVANFGTQTPARLAARLETIAESGLPPEEINQ